MKKIGNKFILIVISIIVFIVVSQVVMAYINNNADTNSYLTLVKGNGTLNDARLSTNQQYVLFSGDQVRVIGDSSLAVIQWGDGSVTRLGGNTKISIQQNEISRDYTKINISFDLLAGKTWSNVVSFIGKDSSFTQSFDGVEAGVRGTVFDVDLDKQFIHVSDHLVEIVDDSGKIFMLGEGKSLSLDTFSFIEVADFIASLEDSAWIKLNEQFDHEYISKLSAELDASLEGKHPLLFILEFFSPKYRILHELDNSSDFKIIEKSINKVSEKSKPGVYNAVLSKYQSLNFVDVSNYQHYKRKIFYKKALILLGDGQQDTQQLIQSTAYDLQDIIESKNIEGIRETLSLLNEHSDFISEIDMSFLSGGLDYLPAGLLEEFSSSFSDIGNLLNIDLDTIKSINIDTLGDVLDGADAKIQDVLDKNVGGLLRKIAQ